MERSFKVDTVGGSPIFDRVNKAGTIRFDSITFDGNSCLIKSDDKGERTEVLADFDSADFIIETTYPYENWDRWDQRRELYFNLRLRVSHYTMKTEQYPVEMTLDEIEKELGHKVLVVNK